MFFKLSLVALVAPLVSGLVLQVPQNPTSGGTVTISWTNQQGDPSTWSFELTNESFNNAFAVANNVDPSLNSITITLPVVPIGDGYTLEAVNIGNISDVFASTGDFSIANGTSTSTSSATSSTASTTSKVSTSTPTVSGTTSSVTSTSTSAPFTSVIVSSTAPASSATAATTTSASSAAITPTSAAVSSRMSLGGSIGGFAVAILSAAAGVALITL
ncbi:hypothetical protein HYPSUDRAFT_33684 [Hypholoma sublateritium FD-334 SS-4]|uniref:Yeast cell wall synthesis Kre9/Knh1-like N-terminal domain-containing protein n=1 Tax=Hypholoma sublateritium (strain FD-334 SS-4) TaxID=945553 RepID=A0A0D2LKP6_HYPSF|nr:hypothetical protein HYPSUDRAFT_33684 [Hypholoma sublateritium FD-334 SS-4]